MKPAHFQPVERRSPPLRPVRFGCLTGIPSLNLTSGCSHRCLYCYAQGYPGAPPRGRVLVYTNLPYWLERILSKGGPSFVVFGTASDTFQNNPLVLETAWKCLEILLRKSVATISVLTKGHIPSEFIGLFRRYRGRVKVHIGLITLNEAARRIWEPGASPVEARLKNLEVLADCGVLVSVRVDPIIPSWTDSEENFRSLFCAVRERGVEEVTLSALHIRHGIEPVIAEALGRREWFNLLAFYEQRWSTVGCATRARLVRKALLERIYSRALRAARDAGVCARICACKNPGMGEVCASGRGFYTFPVQQKLSFNN